ncbi:L,D-transpeptidase family protein [Parasphingorhabdus halotolerans]|uniref:L,D-transpeptidase family protein n=1 Tax=Parasphingorhabdus halotolerans TaxID=2725558 RepID=A0A6H2DRD0_9SPHN|nr:L,D-transpeptidase family protein [Parasphingorhabdus halotolerans]QJB70505.1 L,D-transpeptidase family protein [Parasphingorhabdus halotolerans]
MRITITVIAAFVLAWTVPVQSQDASRWNALQIAQLQTLIDDLPAQGLDACNVSNTSAKDDAQLMIVAKQLADAYLEGCNRGIGRLRWHIESRDNLIDTGKLLRLALQRDELGPLFGALRPQNPNYLALRAALQTEVDPEKQRILKLNMERWRWMPLYLGEKYLVVNAASFEVTLWENHKPVGRWPVIVGKATSQTPVFDTRVEGVTLNPWWEIPSSIVAEGIGSMVRNNPTAARRKGYVVQDGQYRQRPGPGNALGQMKLIMPNPYSVKLHDTSNRSLFTKQVRTLSHGCVRVGDAIGFAKTILAQDMSSAAVDNILDSRTTKSVKITQTIPIYITYFTAGMDAEGGVAFFPDVYGRDSVRLAEREPFRDECHS